MKESFMANFIRPDFIFSYWIFAWFVLHFLRFVKASPKLLIILGLIENIVSVLFILKAGFYYVFRFVFINFFLKVVPLMLMSHQKITKYDLLFSIGVFLVYLVYLLFNKESIVAIYKEIYNAQFDVSKTQGPLSHYYDKVFNALFKK